MAKELSQFEVNRMRKQLLMDKGPSSRAQSYQFVFWRQLGDQLGQPFDSTKIPLSKLYQMRRDPMLAFGLHFIKVPMIRAPWYIKCEDAQVAAFVDTALRKIYPRLVLQYMQCLDFGYSAIVKRYETGNPTGTYIDPNDPDKKEKPIWDEGNIDAIVFKNFIGLPPDQVEPLWTETGEFNGIRYDVKKDVPLAFPTAYKEDFGEGQKVPQNLSLWITNEKDTVFGSPWGYPRLGYSFRYWWSYWYRWALADRHFEKDADPAAVVRYPDDPNNEVLDDTGTPVDFREVALAIGEQARSGSTIAMPSNVIESEIDGRISSIPEWDIKFVEGNSNFDAFDQTFDRLEILKLRSIWVPEQAFLEGKGGTSSRNVAQTLTDSFQESQAVLMAEFDDHLNRYVIPQLVQVNFPEFNGEVCKVTRGFGSEDIDFAKQIIQLIGQQDANKLEVDVRPILDQIGIPLKSPEVLEKERQQAIKDAQEMAPPQDIKPVAGKQAGTVKTASKARKEGYDVKYIQPRGVIYLSSEDRRDLKPFAAGLPDTPHYKDSQIVDLTKDHREFWKHILNDFYDQAAAHITSELVNENFAEDDDSFSRASGMIKHFSYNMNAAKSKAKAYLQKIMERAGNAALKRAQLPTDLWDPTAVTPATWAERNALALATGIQETTKNELRIFIASQIQEGKTNAEIAQGIRDHFREFPDWRADRIARTETMMAYNYATLFAGQAAGLNNVQAIDAQKGKTDIECVLRNGKIFSIDDALNENEKEHPNGTLAWRLLRTTNLSIEHVQAEGDKLAWYDSETETIYMSEDISAKDEERYLIAIGDELSRDLS